MAGESTMDKIKGKAKAMMGKAKGDERMKSEGKTDQAKGRGKEAMGDTSDRAKGMKDSLKNDDK